MVDRRSARVLSPFSEEASGFFWGCTTTTLAGSSECTTELPLKKTRSGREDLNLRLFGPEPNALPGCATPRVERWGVFYPPASALSTESGGRPTRGAPWKIL